MPGRAGWRRLAGLLLFSDYCFVARPAPSDEPSCAVGARVDVNGAGGGGAAFGVDLNLGGAVNSWLAGLGLRCGGSCKRFLGDGWLLAASVLVVADAADVTGAAVVLRSAVSPCEDAGVSVGDGVSSFLFFVGTMVIAGLSE